MAKKIVRGITDVKTINNQDYDTNNVNDLLSDGQYNYIHRKKGKNEEYHNLTDNIKTLSSDNTELLSVTNNNKTTNTATLHPKHDAQKEQVLESTRNTISIHHGTNGTDEKTTVDTNPQKVLEHENLLTDYGISKTTTGNTTKLGLEYTKADGLDLNDLVNGCIRGANLINAPSREFYYVSSFTEYNYCLQEATKLTDYNSTTYKRLKYNGEWLAWREQVGDKSTIDGLLAQKEQVLESTRDTITIQHGTNGTDETTKIDVNTHKVLTHNNLLSSSPLLTVEHQDNTDTTTIKAAKLEESYNYVERQKQNTENYYICMEDVAGTVTLTKLDNDIVLPNQTVKAVLEYSFYVCFDETDSQDYEKYIEGSIKNITDNSGGYGIYTDVTNPTLFSEIYMNYMIDGNTSYYYENGGITIAYNGTYFYIFAYREKVPLGKTINLTGKVPLVELPQGGGEGGGGAS